MSPRGVFSPDGQTLYTCSLDGAIFAWDIGHERSFGISFVAAPASKLGVRSVVSEGAPALAVSPDGRRFATAVGRSRVGIFRTDTGAEQSGFDVSTGGDISALAWSRSGGLAVSGDEGQVQIWDVSGRPHLARILHGIGSVDKQAEAVTTLTYSPDGSLVAAGDVSQVWSYGTVAVWDAATGRMLWKVLNKQAGVNAVAFSPDGTKLAAGQESNRVTIYDAHSGRVRRIVHPEGDWGTLSQRSAGPACSRRAAGPGSSSSGIRRRDGRSASRRWWPRLRSRASRSAPAVRRSRRPAARMVSQGSGRAQRCSRWEAHWSERGEHGAALPTLLTVGNWSSSTTTVRGTCGRHPSQRGSATPVRSPAAT